MTSSDSPSSSINTTRPLNVLEDSWLLQDVQAWKIEEHHLRLDALLHSASSSSTTVLDAGHPLNAHVPLDLEIVRKDAKVWSMSDGRWMDGMIVRRRSMRGLGGKELFYE